MSITDMYSPNGNDKMEGDKNKEYYLARNNMPLEYTYVLARVYLSLILVVGSRDGWRLEKFIYMNTMSRHLYLDNKCPCCAAVEPYHPTILNQLEQCQNLNRIPMPMTLEEYQIGQGYTTVETSKLETGGGDGVEEITNESFIDHDLGSFGIQSGHYSLRRYHLDRKVPAFVKIVTPRDSLYLQEESWNAYPRCRTVLTNDYLNERFAITVESIHLPDKGDTENALGLPPEKLSQREVIFIDIAKDLGSEEASMLDTRLDGVTSTKTNPNRGPLSPNWFCNHTPVMTCYKLVTCEVKIFGLQSRLENFVIENQRKIFTAFHRRVFIFMDQWYGLTITDIRKLENEVAEQLEHLRKFGEVRGTRVADDA